MNVIHPPLEENITNLQPSYRQHISRAVLEAVCFQVMPSSKNIVRVLVILILDFFGNVLQALAVIIITTTSGC